MVVANVLGQETFQMPLVEHDDVVEQVASAIAYPTFGDSVLPRTSETGSFGLDAEACYGADNFRVEVRGSVEEQIARRRIIRKCLAMLLRYPIAARMTGHVAVENAPPTMRDDEETVDNAERHRRHGEEIHCGNGFSVVDQRAILFGKPGLRKRASCRLWIGRRKQSIVVAPVRIHYVNLMLDLGGNVGAETHDRLFVRSGRKI